MHKKEKEKRKNNNNEKFRYVQSKIENQSYNKMESTG